MKRDDSAISGPGRPRRFDESVALSAAMSLFWREGYRGATTRRLEECLGIKASSLYNAFGSKEALLHAAMARYEEEITGQLLVPLEVSSTGLAALEEFFDAFETWVRGDGSRGCLLVNMMAEDGGATPEVSKRLGSYRLRLKDAFLHALRDAAASGQMADTDVVSRADLLLALVLGLNIAARSGASPQELSSILGSIHTQIHAWQHQLSVAGD